ncbi:MULTISPECIES: helix-turn-helix transcriptional regulator [unclassified Crossiella]|uniref:ArsR/SmtB family transcription factor n=1 Tax=unclassified Crossiella TaxID=2620835 RepID=UPI001FFF9228|nr:MULTISPECIES: metalloregulator ArsR/SmtB family transcription factor [unclassified Crossiella]MCK2244127.1 metalloregulator ArsR/SmtB family transcription factor [Crossiella sp. S99.2]MCK2257931.1 metalloregulator ArsR/SmtB family transcription factor [Crossiella sp. S99.1]
MRLDTDILRLIADPLRARILELLATEALCTCHLIEETGAKQANISNHLRALREAGLVEAEPCGKFTYYSLRPEALRGAAASLTALADRAERHPQARRPC